MDISLNGFLENAATFAAAEGTVPGIPVKLTANGSVGPCAAGDGFCGVALNVRGGYASVQLRGYVVLSYSGTAPAPGWQGLLAAADGKVEADASGHAFLVTDVDTAAQTCGMIL